MLSSATQRGLASRCRELNFAGYLVKPVAQSDLLEAISALVGYPASAHESASPWTGAAQKRSQRSLRILLAEDNLINQRVTARMLEKRGHKVMIAADGRQAVSAYEREPLDMILMDAQMPEMNGLEATAAIREKEQKTGKHIPIIAMTARAR